MSQTVSPSTCVECFARRRVSLSQATAIACDRPSPWSDRPLSGC